MSDEKVEGPGGGERPAEALDNDTGKFEPIRPEDVSNVKTEDVVKDPAAFGIGERPDGGAAGPEIPVELPGTPDHGGEPEFTDCATEASRREYIRGEIKKSLQDAETEAAVLDALRESYANGRPHRVLEAGTKVFLVGPHGLSQELALLSPAVVDAGQRANSDDTAFAGLIAGHEENFRLNKGQLAGKHSPLTGALLPEECDDCGALVVEGACTNPACPGKLRRVKEEQARIAAEKEAAEADKQEH
jgi:hypothetical protein